ncbi:7265_t:CDS:2 [Diversispora eburnea]|uniref:7265_t:CDS:1 n=1 Tax=Diversispora eburnea TaxID=1213867 RepID=A0A9N8YN09_9GLOM|nr:7265_t:CDS:2 [Diversispora eburnea]
MLAPTSSASLVSQENYSEHSNATPSDSLSNATVNDEEDVNSNNNFSSYPTTFLLYYWAIFCTFISNIFSKTSLQSSSYMTRGPITTITPDTNNNNINQSQQPLRRSPRFKPKKQLQQTLATIEELKTSNSVIRMKHNKKQFNQTALSPSMMTSLLKAKTLILDLDETLVHSTSRGARTDAHMIEVMVDNHACLYYMHKRPHVDHFLKKVSEWYKVIIFTASMPEYADPVIDLLDPNRNLISRRLFHLTIVEPDLSRVCIVDNSPISYAMHQENGIPIEGWINDPFDEALLDLLPFLDALRFTEDVRSILSLQTY